MDMRLVRFQSFSDLSIPANPDGDTPETIDFENPPTPMPGLELECARPPADGILVLFARRRVVPMGEPESENGQANVPNLVAATAHYEVQNPSLDNSNSVFLYQHGPSPAPIEHVDVDLCVLVPA